jgi:hypothetical protein
MVRRIRIRAPIAVNAGKYSHRLIKGGVGHNLPLEAPRAFAEAVIEPTVTVLDRL